MGEEAGSSPERDRNGVCMRVCVRACMCVCVCTKAVFHIPIPFFHTKTMFCRSETSWLCIPHLPNVVQEFWGRETVLRAGELAAVVLKERQQVRFQGEEPAGWGQCQQQ